MWWVIWILLLVASGVYLGVRLWGLWGHIKALGSEIVAAQRRLDEVAGKLEVLGDLLKSPADLAIFAGPVTARIRRDRAKADSRRARGLRRAISRPAWAKHVDL
jgi:hypothetical protein